MDVVVVTSIRVNMRVLVKMSVDKMSCSKPGCHENPPPFHLLVCQSINLTFHEKVYDIQDIKAEVPMAEEISSSSLEALEEEDPDLKERLNSYVVGVYLKPEDDVVQLSDSSTVSSPLIDTER